MKKVLFIFIIFITNYTFSQQITQEKITTFLINNPYFNNNKEELFFLHTNKTIYFSGESVWFAAYILNKISEKPSSITKNLHINLYNSDFKLIAQKLYYVNEGKTSGQFKLLENLTSGNYYLELDTNWNRNFKKGTTTKIEIINLKKAVEETVAKSNTSIANKDLKNIEKTKKNKAFINRNLKEFNSTTFNFNIDKILHEKYKEKTLFAVLHKNNIANSCAAIEIGSKKKYTIKFDPQFLLNGKNTVTLFDENNKIIAKKAFWNFKSKIGELEITKKKKTKDSLYLNLKLPKNSSKSNLSISILNAENEIVFNQKTILNSFLDTDYNEVIKQEKNKNLTDFLNKRSSNFSLLKTNNNIVFKNETGVIIKGKVNSKIEDLNQYKVMLSSKENELFIVSDIQKDNSFEFNNLHIKHPSKYKLSLIDNKGKTSISNFYIYSNYYAYKADRVLKSIKNNDFKKVKKKNLKKPENLISIKKDFIQLEEVEIKAIVDKEKEKEIIKKYKNINGVDVFTSFYIPDENLSVGIDIFQYLGTLPGLKIVYVELSNVPYVFNTRGPKSISGGSQLVNVKLNGTPLGEELDPLVGMTTSDFEVILVNLMGAGEGLRGANGVVNLIQKKGGNYNKRKLVRNKEIETITGYEKSAIKYVKPIMEFRDVNSMKSYNVIDWIPELKIETNNATLLKIPLYKNQKNIKLIINGFSIDGTLIHKTVVINDSFK